MAKWTEPRPIDVPDALLRALPLLEYAHSHEHGGEELTALLDKVRRLLPDPSNARLARVSMRHPLDPG